MDPTLWPRVETIFAEALERSADERTAWLRNACGDDPALYQQVAALLEGDADPATVFGSLAVDLLSPEDREQMFAERPEAVGPWRITGHLGTGGMGTVYRAERADAAFEQTVALKLVKRGMDTDAVLARFQSERRILAGLEHPGIARLVDGGVSDDGRPYLAMEYVEGEPITDYCDRRRLGVGERLRLVEAVGEAVAFAHQNLVVHRDLKPSNVLVTEADGTPRVKLLDFGIAKVLAEGDDAFLTRTGQRAFTPSYAAPEQLRGGPITTATDVYGLGAVLYRLLTGARPIPTEGRSPAEVEIAILTEEPLRPSAAARAAPEAASARDTTPDRLRRRLSGDLDRIALRALRKDPAERYASVQDLVDDLRRHREGLPIAAQPATPAYRLRKFVGRHRGVVAASAAALVAVALVTTVAFARVSAERDRARAEAVKAEEVSAFLADLFAGSDPAQTRGADVTARELLEQGAARIAADLADQPAVQAQMLHVIGRVYQRVGEYDEAEARLGDALALRRRLDPDHPDVAATLDEFGLLYERQGRYAEAAEAHAAAAALLRDHAGERPVALANALHGLALAQMRLLALTEAERNIGEALAIKRRVLGTRHPEVAYSLNILGDVYTHQHRLDEAEAVHLEAIDMRRDLLGEDHLDVAVSLHNLAAAYRDAGRWADAERRYREALDILEVHYPEGNQKTANALSQLGLAVGMQGRFDEAEAIHDDGLALTRRVLGDEHVRIAGVLVRRGTVLEHEGRHAEAEALTRDGLAMWRRTVGEDTPQVPLWTLILARLAAAQGHLGEAEALVAESRRACDRLTNARQAAACVEAAQAALNEVRTQTSAG